MFRFEFQKLWIIYLVTSYTLFTLPEPVFSHNSIFLRSSFNSTSTPAPTTSTTQSSTDPTGAGEVQIAEESAPLKTEALLVRPGGDNVVAAESLNIFSRGKRPPPKRFLPRPSKRPPPDEHPRHPGHREKIAMIKKSKLKQKKPLFNVPKIRKQMHDRDRFRKPMPQSHPHDRERDREPDYVVRYQEPRERERDRDRERERNHERERERERDRSRERERERERERDRHRDHERSRERERKPITPRVPITRFLMTEAPPLPSPRESIESSAGNSLEVRSPVRLLKLQLYPQFVSKANKVLVPSVVSNNIGSDFFPSAIGSTGSGSMSEEKGRDSNVPTIRGTEAIAPAQSAFKESWPNEGYIPTDDKHALVDLIENHHLRRRKECDGLENFVYDLEIISFLLGVIAACFGLYSDIIPFFNEGVKISYNQDFYGEGVDFPHDYWPKHDTQIDLSKRTGKQTGTTATNPLSTSYAESLRTIALGTSNDSAKEIMSVTGEFIGLLGLGFSFVALFPSLVEKFFYSLDYWFGKRGLWKQYLYTYKCEVYKYPQPGWGKVGR